MSEHASPQRRPDGFLERGASVTRLEAFVDAAFAFAVTLLVISLDSVPSSIGSMVQALKGVPAFAASFAQIMIFWSATPPGAAGSGSTMPAASGWACCWCFWCWSTSTR